MQNNRHAPEKLKISLNSMSQSEGSIIENDTVIDYNIIDETNNIMNVKILDVAEIEQDCGHIENVIDNYIAPPVEQAEVFLIKEYLESYKNTIIDEMTKKFELSDFEDRKKTKQREFDNLENLIIARKEALNDISQKIELLRDEWVYGMTKAIDDLISASLFEFESKILNT